MVIKQIRVKNFRLLKDFVIDLQPDLSLIVGKNNVGKTSLLIVLDKFINSGKERTRKFQYNDFNLDFQKEIEDILEQPQLEEKDYQSIGISLRLIAEFSDSDSLDNIGNKILTNLEDGNNYFAIGFDYQLDYNCYSRLITDYNHVKSKFTATHQNENSETKFDKREFMNANHSKYFQIVRKSVHVEKQDMVLNENRFIKLDGLQGFHLDDVINFEYISARRGVDNKDADHTLSEQTSKLYDVQGEDESNADTREQFIARLKETDQELTKIYSNIFDNIIKTIGDLGGMRKQETLIKVVSTLRHRELLKGNTTVVYEHSQRDLPENYNGLGYMNLISMIFEIKLIVERMKRVTNRRPADINLLIIEEPEAHTHPQMQYVFIRNIKKLLGDGIVGKNGVKSTLQSIITTHSSHIVANCDDFKAIKYLKRSDFSNCVISKNLQDLAKMYEDDDNAYRFLKQYLTVMNSELFFADKAVFIEGDTERILLPLMMKKIDDEQKPDESNGELGLLSQKISVLPVGAHSHIFEKFFHFIGLTKMLVITDIDICSPEGHHKKCQYEEGNLYVTSNAALKHYFNNNCDVAFYMRLLPKDKLFSWNDADNKMSCDEDGNMMVCFQTKEGDYQPRSFEDDFFKLNADFIKQSDIDETALNADALSTFKNDQNPYNLAANGIESKAALAINLILAEKEGNTWQVPTYIKEGLLWLRS